MTDADDRYRSVRCRDCGAPGELTGHMGCQYPQDYDDQAGGVAVVLEVEVVEVEW